MNWMGGRMQTECVKDYDGRIKGVETRIGFIDEQQNLEANNVVVLLVLSNDGRYQEV